MKSVLGQGHLLVGSFETTEFENERNAKVLRASGFKSVPARNGNGLVVWPPDGGAVLPMEARLEVGGGYNDPGRYADLPAGTRVERLTPGNAESYSQWAIG